MLDAHIFDRLASASKRARDAEARGEDALAGEEWRRYRLVRDAGRDPDELRYVLIGGVALIRHGVVRATRHVDAVFDPDSVNVERIVLLSSSGGRLVPTVRRSEKAWPLHTPICSLADLVALKRVAGRERDRVDLADLEAAHGELPTVAIQASDVGAAPAPGSA